MATANFWEFTKQPNKIGYSNNPFWVSEDEVTPVHIPCGYWWSQPAFPTTGGSGDDDSRDDVPPDGGGPEDYGPPDVPTPPEPPPTPVIRTYPLFISDETGVNAIKRFDIVMSDDEIDSITHIASANRDNITNPGGLAYTLGRLFVADVDSQLCAYNPLTLAFEDSEATSEAWFVSEFDGKVYVTDASADLVNIHDANSLSIVDSFVPEPPAHTGAQGIAVDISGIYISNPGSTFPQAKIYKYATASNAFVDSGVYETIGSNFPTQVSIDNEHIYTVDKYQAKIYKIAKDDLSVVDTYPIPFDVMLEPSSISVNNQLVVVGARDWESNNLIAIYLKSDMSLLTTFGAYGETSDPNEFENVFAVYIGGAL